MLNVRKYFKCTLETEANMNHGSTLIPLLWLFINHNDRTCTLRNDMMQKIVQQRVGNSSKIILKSNARFLYPIHSLKLNFENLIKFEILFPRVCNFT